MKCIPALILAAALVAPAAYAQEAPPDFRDEFLSHFQYSTNRLLALAEAMPEETYTWRPMDGVSTVAEVYMHIARYNYYYPETALGIPVPDGVDLDALETITDKAEVVEQLRRSVEHVREAVQELPESALNEPTELYGRTMGGWGVLLQLLAHMNEHVGQSIAYARMNEVVPPWSR